MDTDGTADDTKTGRVATEIYLKSLVSDRIITLVSSAHDQRMTKRMTLKRAELILKY